MGLFSRKKKKQEEESSVNELNPFNNPSNTEIPKIPTLDNSNQGEIPIPPPPNFNKQQNMDFAADLHPQIPEIPNIPETKKPESHSEDELKKVISAEMPKKTEYDATKVNKEREYLDEILDKDLNLDSQEVEMVIQKVEKPKEITPEIHDKIHKHDEVIYIEHEQEPELIKPKNQIQKEQTYENNESAKNPVHNEKIVFLPEFEDEEQRLDQKTKEVIEKFKQRKIITGDLFVNSETYKETLSTNLSLKEDGKNIIKKTNNLISTLNAQQKSNDKLKEEITFISNSLMIVEEKLFEKNPYLR